MARWGEFNWGEALWGEDQPIVQSTSLTVGPVASIEGVANTGPQYVRTKSANHRRRIRDGLTGDIITSVHTDPSGDGRIILGGALHEQEDEAPRYSGNIIVANPDGDMEGRFAEDQVILVEDELSYPNGLVYNSNTARVGIIEIRTEGLPDEESLELIVESDSQIYLDGSFLGDLITMTEVIDVARGLGMMAPDNIAPSVEAILAFLLLDGGATGIGIEGRITPTSPYTRKFGTKYLSPFTIGREEPLIDIVHRCEDMAGVTYWVDWDGTAVIKALPRNVFDIYNPPQRRYSESGPDAVVTRNRPSSRVNLERVGLFNQSTASQPRVIRYVMPPGGGIPVADASTTGMIRGSYTRFDSTLFADPDVDPESQDERAMQLVFLEAQKGASVEFTIPPDPFIHAGDTVIMDFPSRSVVGLYRITSITRDLGDGDDVIVASKVFFPNEPGSGTVGGLAYAWATQVPRFALVTYLDIMPYSALITGPYRTDVYHYTPSVFEGWIKSKFWPKLAGTNIRMALLNTTNTVVVLIPKGGSPGGALMDCFVYVYDETGEAFNTKVVIATLGPFDVNVTENVWRHWALQRETGWVGIWVGGVLKASASGSFGLTSTGQLNYSKAKYFNVNLMMREGEQAIIRPDTQGEIAFAGWRFTRTAIYPHTNITPPTFASFAAYDYNSYPVVASIWPMLGLSEADGFDTAWSSTSPLYAVLSNLSRAAGGEDPPA